jgi:para-aminobenzoate synthetase/4-amino-4-deoxychorismate lyase
MRIDPIVIIGSGNGEGMLRFTNPTQCVCAETPAQVPEAIAALQAALNQGQFIAGWFGYDVGASLVNPAALPRAAQTTPFLWFGAFSAPVCITRHELLSSGRAYAGPLSHEWDRAEYRERFDQVQEHIRAGDIYQANLSFRSRFRFIGDPLDLYLRLYDSARVPHAAYIDTGHVQVLSLSPELFFAIDAGVIATQPMKGTAARGATVRGDSDARDALASSPKDRAENVMIVDLMRNDVGRLARPGTVRVTELLGLRTYPTYHTLVSTITADLAGDVQIESLLSALMPAGSITGAPKLRAMRILRDLESSPREIYCGAIGHIAPGGAASFNVAIRTLWLTGQTGTTGVGGGVVADSGADAEYDECLLKAGWYSATRRPIGLFETLRWDEGFKNLDSHLDRMSRSAEFFAIPFAGATARSVLQNAVGNGSGPMRVRLELDEQGEFHCITQALAPTDGVWRFVISPHRVSSRDALLAHKTTWRELYDAEWKRCCAEGQAEEVLFLNERAELTEGARTNLFIRLDGELATPALCSGLLPGVLRAELIARGNCRERRLTLAELGAASEIFVGNSLRGLIPAVPAESMIHRHRGVEYC